MKIIDKVLKENPGIQKQTLFMFNCPSDFGHKDAVPCNFYGPGERECVTCWNRDVEKEERRMEIQIESKQEAWELKRAVKKNLIEKCDSIKNLEIEKRLMRAIGVKEDIIFSSVGERILNLKRDKKTCIKIIGKLNKFIFEDEGVCPKVTIPLEEGKEC